ncbi:MAG: peptidoglycan editing factor PgeF [Rhizobacter sp.]|nr:peptidoglycan editing factor PgeF [Rhizobacter sp.]
MTLHPDWLAPDWGLPRVGALMTTRAGGGSVAPFDSMNLRDGLGDDPAAVAGNRQRLARALGGARAVFLNQVHGAAVVRLGGEHAEPGTPLPLADACVTTEAGIACAVQVADCLPVLFVAAEGRAVAAAHAGWRGLACGVLEATVVAMCESAHCTPGEVRAWLGACIGPNRFEVGADVLQAFGADPAHAAPDRFRRIRPAKWLANLPMLARDRLREAGVTQVSGGGWCTAEEVSRFFSFRRDRITGRMVAAVWIRPLAQGG